MIYSKLKKTFWVLFTVSCIILTPVVFRHAYEQRGYFAIGGEIFLPFIPLVLWLFIKAIKDMFKELKKK